MTSPIVSGSFTSTGGPQNVYIPCGVDGIFMFNRTQAASTANPGVVKRAWWLSTMAQGSAYTVTNTNSAATDQSNIITSGGFSAFASAPVVMGAQIALAAPFFTQASQAVFTTATPHGYQVGDIVRVYGLTGALQYSGLDLSVIAVTSTTFTTYLNTTGITQPTAGFVRKVSSDGLYFPKNRYIASATSSGVSTVVTTTVAHGYKVGQQVVFTIPTVTSTAFGMTQLNQLLGTITAVNSTVGTNTFTVNIDSSAFGAFVYPASTNVPFSFATVTPNSDGQPNPLTIPPPDSNVLVGAIDNQGIRGITFGSSVCGAASDVIDWYAFQSVQVNP